MYTYIETKTPNRITRIEIYLDGHSVKVIRHKDRSQAIAQKDYYIRMMTGVNSYTAWLKKS